MKSENLFSDQESQDLDKISISESGIRAEILMGFAALSIFQTWYSQFLEYKQIVILSGSGNNGGDGFALAHFLSAEKIKCKVFFKEGTHSEETIFYKNLAETSGAELLPLEKFKASDFSEQILVVDALLGTGFRGKLTGVVENAISEIRKLQSRSDIRKFVISIDCISGYDPEAKAPFVPDAIAEIGMPKLRNLIFPEKISKKTFHPIGFKREEFSTEAKVLLPAKIEEIQPYLHRDPSSHKYGNGSAFFLGGSQGMTGAILSSVLTFHELGGGISTILSPSEKTIQKVLKKDPSLMIENWNPKENPFHSNFLKKAKVIVLGPGLSREDSAIQWSLPQRIPIVVDAGAILPISKLELGKNTLLTPHIGEWSQISGKTYSSLPQAWEDAKVWAKEKSCYLLLKSYVSILCTPEAKSYFWRGQDPKLAVMGTGDVLAGMIAFFLAKGENIADSVRLSHSLLSILAANREGYPTAGKIRKSIRKVIAHG
ncbi:bifunctional ADP-dependent (S)-NAD(P)H-hydrate dehydratase/NAD(P)H-hydrate epimerase [Leptospira perolatii]|uniref:ADP-dependent (S)-NAD(P)H-hydrate dehydratase n=1 Tax=Leptospira perolatii TaxID=2023191 RepID=A0A2M9ZK26_9LEPT|nr:bifunctional ADP-dependent NAD(P)H-hydrate dehydratase/NAD(P)H-hydrate epimerase [Leptospira perolatii]PJZ69193.1 bifunctional ADP-dependent (S)-NAD(P)H-hydrate dehydratase/NAD(P)H-hydrate epimerase [Leptospira perolatii]PJZ72425.1 bifunctional ADP-dependent (S)-NAD(P)H-hydrate dehydratase/NAD(P)H-hydrate epimerase [Leptospira perolatii]